MASAKQIEKQLSQRQYRYPEPTAKDIQKCLSTYSDLRPSTSEYVFPDGTAKELMNLHGTIPITYKGSTYNIPVEIWIMDTHPWNPPLCYVKPTADMKIKQNRHVDMNGRVYLPYLTNWSHNKSDLLECCRIMAGVFGEEPPVFSKKSTNQQRPAGGFGGSASPVTSYQGGMPMPVMPGAGGYPQYPMVPPTGYPPQQFPAYPGGPYPPTGSQQNPSYPPAGAYNAPNNNRSSFPPFPMNNNGANYPSVNNPFGSYSSNTGDSNSATNTGTVTDEHIRASLLSAVEEKLGRRLNEIVTQAQIEIAGLQKTHDDLERGRKELDDIFAKLEKEQRTVDRNITLLTEKIKELRSAVEKNSENETVDIDEAVVPAAPLYKQLLNAYAEDSALEDAVYYLGEALRREVIDLEVFLKHVRELSRKQFLQRALMQRCRDKAGLP